MHITMPKEIFKGQALEEHDVNTFSDYVLIRVKITSQDLHTSISCSCASYEHPASFFTRNLHMFKILRVCLHDLLCLILQDAAETKPSTRTHHT
mmetsp:Transcript_3418/g.8886  ORF Transcript_3418/g.8886 Transcript_3418/m.8886 type:complete len:94 (+) Transcript_3418:147-428(+)